MKKIIISLITTSIFASIFLFTGCFTDSDTATVKINLGNIPISKTAKVKKKSLIDRFLMFFAKEAVAQPIDVMVVHLGAFDANNRLLAKKSITAMRDGEPVPVNTVEFDVPARSGVRIVVLGEPDYEDGDIYYGCSEPLNLTAGATEEVEGYMTNLNYYFINDMNFRYDEEHPDHDPYPDFGQGSVAIEWDRVYGVSKYIIDYVMFQYDPGEGETPSWANIHKFPNENCINEYLNLAAGNSYRIKLEFNFAGINSEQVAFSMDNP